jgi:hypothetical protein
MSSIFDVLFQFLEGCDEFVTHEAIRLQLHLVSFFQLPVMFGLPVSHVQSFEISPFRGAIRVDDDELRKRQNLDSALSIELNGEIMVIGAGKSAVLGLDVVAHEEGAEMRAHFVEFHFHHVL